MTTNPYTPPVSKPPELETSIHDGLVRRGRSVCLFIGIYYVTVPIVDCVSVVVTLFLSDPRPSASMVIGVSLLYLIFRFLPGVALAMALFHSISWSRVMIGLCSGGAVGLMLVSAMRWSFETRGDAAWALIRGVVDALIVVMIVFSNSLAAYLKKIAADRKRRYYENLVPHSHSRTT